MTDALLRTLQREAEHDPRARERLLVEQLRRADFSTPRAWLLPLLARTDARLAIPRLGTLLDLAAREAHGVAWILVASQANRRVEGLTFVGEVLAQHPEGWSVRVHSYAERRGRSLRDSLAVRVDGDRVVVGSRISYGTGTEILYGLQLDGTPCVGSLVFVDYAGNLTTVQVVEGWSLYALAVRVTHDEREWLVLGVGEGPGVWSRSPAGSPTRAWPALGTSTGHWTHATGHTEHGDEIMVPTGAQIGRCRAWALTEAPDRLRLPLAGARDWAAALQREGTLFA